MMLKASLCFNCSVYVSENVECVNIHTTFHFYFGLNRVFVLQRCFDEKNKFWKR